MTGPVAFESECLTPEIRLIHPMICSRRAEDLLSMCDLDFVRRAMLENRHGAYSVLRKRKTYPD